MPLAGKAIKQKLRSVKNIGKITKTMEMISVSKMKKASERNTASRYYSNYALEILKELSLSLNLSHPLLEKKDAQKTLLVLISSNKGLSGPYNININKAILNYKSKFEEEIDCITIGKRSEKGARGAGFNVIASFTDFHEKSSSEDFFLIKNLVLKEFESGKYKNVKILFTEFKSAVSYKTLAVQILPVDPKIYQNILIEEEGIQSTKKDSEYIFEPSKEEVLDSTLKQLVGQIIFHSFLESQASEHSARMFAMKNASDNAKDIIKDLTLYHNKLRQSTITQELSEIVAGAGAMN